MFELLTIAIFIWLLVKAIDLGRSEDRRKYSDRSGISCTDRLPDIRRRHRTAGTHRYDRNCGGNLKGLPVK